MESTAEAYVVPYEPYAMRAAVKPLHAVTRLNQNLAYTFIFFEHKLKSAGKWRYKRGPE